MSDNKLKKSIIKSIPGNKKCAEPKCKTFITYDDGVICKKCGQTYCIPHRLPFDHTCTVYKKPLILKPLIQQPLFQQELSHKIYTQLKNLKNYTIIIFTFIIIYYIYNFSIN
jgi:hypothetical protein